MFHACSPRGTSRFRTGAATTCMASLPPALCRPRTNPTHPSPSLYSLRFFQGGALNRTPAWLADGWRKPPARPGCRLGGARRAARLIWMKPCWLGRGGPRRARRSVVSPPMPGQSGGGSSPRRRALSGRSKRQAARPAGHACRSTPRAEWGDQASPASCRSSPRGPPSGSRFARGQPSHFGRVPQCSFPTRTNNA